MALDRPFIINLYWDNNGDCHGEFDKGFQPTFTTSIVFRHKMGFEEFVHLVCSHVGVQKASVKLKISLSYQFQGITATVLIISDQSVDTMYYLAEKDENFWGHVYVEVETITHDQTPPQNMKFMDLPNSIVSESFMEDSYPFVEPGELHSESPNNIYAMTTDFLMGSPSTDYNIQNSIGSFPLEDDDKLDVNDIFEFDLSEVLLEDDDKTDLHGNNCTDVWRESENHIREGMLFESKSQVQKAVMLWSISQNREFKVVESKSTKWIAKCNGGSSGTNGHCKWYIRAVKKKNHNMWQITRWVDTHSCCGSSVAKKIRNLNSKTIAAYILHAIRKDIAYPIKSIQEDIKSSLNVDVSYWKAWHGRRKAIESLQNFRE